MAKKPKKKPKKKPEEVGLPYRSLVSEYPNWERVFKSKKEVKEGKKNPSDSDLQLAFLTKIVDLLREIRDEVKREHTIK